MRSTSGQLSEHPVEAESETSLRPQWKRFTEPKHHAAVAASAHTLAPPLALGEPTDAFTDLPHLPRAGQDALAVPPYNLCPKGRSLKWLQCHKTCSSVGTWWSWQNGQTCTMLPALLKPTAGLLKSPVRMPSS